MTFVNKEKPIALTVIILKVVFIINKINLKVKENLLIRFQ